MKKVLFPLIVLAALLAACADEHEVSPTTPQEVAYIDVEPLPELEYWPMSQADVDDMESLADFAFKLNTQVAQAHSSKSENGNYCVSPVSVTMFLTLVSQSVDSEVRAKLCNILGVDETHLISLSNKLLRNLKLKTALGQIALSNSVWHTPQMHISDAYKEMMASNFGATVNPIDMMSPETKDVINRWAKEHTFDMIDNLLEDAPMKAFMIINTLAYQDEWVYQFDENLTGQAVFHGTLGEETADMMHTVAEGLAHYKDSKCEYVSLPLSLRYQMEIIMPSKDISINDFSNNLEYSAFRDIAESSYEKKVTLSLPRFKSGGRDDLKNVLYALGYPAEDMSTIEMTGSNEFPLCEENSTFLHITNLEVYEKGIRMSSATASIWGSDSGERPKWEEVEMVVDRPFLFVIRSRDGGNHAILMMGRVNNL